MTSQRPWIGPSGASLAGLERAIARAAPTGRQWRAWAQTEPGLAALRGVGGLVAELRQAPAGRQDDLLVAVVRLAQHGPHTDTAFGVLVRCLWPGLRHRVALYGSVLEVEDAASILVAALVETVAGYNLASGRRFVASRVLAGPTRRLWRASVKARDANGHHCTLPEIGPNVPHSRSGVPELSSLGLLGLAVDAGVLSAGDAWLIYASRAGGLSLTDAARHLGLTYNAAWHRRRRAELRWATWWAPDRADGEARR